MAKRPNKVAILGTAPTWKGAPFNVKGWEIWVCNRAGLTQEPWDRLFEIHHNWDYENARRREKFLHDLGKIKPPQEVISVVRLPCSPLQGKANTVIDRDAMIKEFGGAIWFSSTFSYMIAHAIQIGAKEIGLWGVDLESREEYITQFAGVRHLLHIAKERGIKVDLVDRSLVLRDPDPYPDRFETALAYKLEEMAHRLDEKQKEARFNLEQCLQYDSDSRRVNEWRDHWGRTKGALWAVQHIRRLFVFNVLDPEPGEELSVDAEESGPT
jgi:hypothetical protein